MGDLAPIFEGVRFIAGGQALLAACMVFYLAWWIVFFNPKLEKPKGTRRTIGVSLIVIAAIFGVGGVAVELWGSIGLWLIHPGPVPFFLIIVVGSAACLLLVIITKYVFLRPPTVELPLFSLWLGLQAFAIDSLLGAGALIGVGFVILVGIALIAFAICLICYIVWAHVPEWPAFIVGCIPLVVLGIVCMLSSVLIWSLSA